MIDRFYSWPIRVHLIILIALLAIPYVALVINSGIDQRRDAITAAKSECLDFVTFIAGRYQSMVAGAEQLGATLSLLPAVQSRNPASTNALLADLLRKNPRYSNIALIDKSGFVWASGIPLQGKLYLGDRKHYRDVIRTGEFSSGEYALGRATGKSVLMFGYPVKNASGELISVIGIVFDLAYAQKYFEQSGFPPGASFSLLDHQGTILIRNTKDPFSQKLIGSRDPRQENFTPMKEGPDEGTFEVLGNDGIFRLAAYKKIRLPHESKPYLYVRSSIPLASAIAKANAAMLRNLSVFGGLFLVALFLAWFIGKRVVANPVKMLKAASQELAAGAETVNVSQVVKVGELGELAQAFDNMAERLIEREAALRGSEERLALAATATQIGMFDWNMARGSVLWTQTHDAIFGYAPASTTTAAEYDYRRWADRVHPEDLLLVEEEMRRCMQDHKPFEMQYRITWPDGSPRWVETRGIFLYDSEKANRMLGVFMDITDRKHMEEALRQSRDELELRVQERTAELNKAYEKLQQEMSEREQIEEQLRQAQKMEAIGTLAGGIAHDFNNILAAILGFTEMAAEDVADRPDVQRSLHNVLKSVTRARELVKQILAFSRKTSHARSPLSLSPIIKETVQLLRASIPATIEINLSLSASSDTILASPVEVQQVLMNLATNASFAMQEKGGTLEISLTDIDFKPDEPVLGTDAIPGQYVLVAVKDTGIGMSPEVMSRVFEPFFTTKEVGKGTGMGLAVVYGIVKDLQGTITVESIPGTGSTFRVLLPKVRTEYKEDQPHTVQIPGGNERILFVDDEEMLVEWGQAALERLGYQVTVTTNSTEALKAFSANPSQFDLVITDHAMPHMAGSELSSELLKIRPDIPIILCTGHSENMSREKAKDLGIKEFLTKPLNKQELAEAVRRVLDTKSEG